MYNSSNNKINDDYEKLIKKMDNLQEIYRIESRISENNNEIIILKIQNISMLSLELIGIMLIVLTQVDLNITATKSFVLMLLIILISIVITWINEHIENKIKTIEKKNDEYREQIDLIKNKK